MLGWGDVVSLQGKETKLNGKSGIWDSQLSELAQNI